MAWPLSGDRDTGIADVIVRRYTPRMTIKLNELPSDDQIERAANQKVDRRRETGQRLIKIGRELLTAQEEVERLTREYSEAYRAATSDAWSAQELSANGIPAPSVTTRRVRGGRRGSNRAEKTPVGDKP